MLGTLTTFAAPPGGPQIPQKSLGVIIHDVLKDRDIGTIMVDSSGEEINSQKFLELSLNLAKKLREIGVKKGDVITIVSHNQSKYLVTVVAGFYLGAQINLLNYDYTSGELKHFLEKCRPVAIFCTSKTLPNVLKLNQEEFFPENVIIYDTKDNLEPQVKNFDQFLAELPSDEDFTPLDLDTKEDVGLILTSSGTTGFPKCVQLTHFNLRVTMLYATDPDILDITEGIVQLGFLPFFHIFGVCTSLAALISGAKSVIVEKFIPDRFLSTIQENRITKLFLVPPVLIFLAKSPLVEKYDLSSISDVVSGAASATKELEEMAEKKLNVTVRQIYGMTEASGGVTCGSKKRKKYGSVGTVIPGFTIRICDSETGKELSANETGELRIKGDGIMKGYLRNEKESEEAFDDEGFLRSGDIGYYDDDGYFYIVDRLKEIIKYKGFQVSPAELESVLIQHPAVKEAGVVGKPDEKGGEVAIAFVVKQTNCEVTEEEIVNHVGENLSVQKHLHGGVRFIDEIPKSSSGKILRRKLKEFL